ncbi:unnamed protein product [Scytosiphon promiscuus]
MADAFQTMMHNVPKQCDKENQGSATGKKAGKGKAKAKDPVKGVLRLPTVPILRKEAGASDEVIANTDPKAVKKFGKDNVKLVHKMVDADWHDGYEEQTEAVVEYFMGFTKFAQGVFDLAVMKGAAFERCHEVLKAFADSWDDMKTIPARCGIEDCFEDAGEDDFCLKVELGEGRGGTHRFANPGEFLSGFWPLLLCASASASEIEDGLLHRWIKDAVDYGADVSRNNVLLKLVEGEKEEVSSKDEAGGSVPGPADKPTLRAKKGGMDLKKGAVRLRQLHANKSLWVGLSSCKKTHKRKRVIDRRFSGPKHRRTRDFDCDDYAGFW